MVLSETLGLPIFQIFAIMFFTSLLLSRGMVAMIVQKMGKCLSITRVNCINLCGGCNKVILAKMIKYVMDCVKVDLFTICFVLT
jgi:hypothetical protein